jgi:hypothetical protein
MNRMLLLHEYEFHSRQDVGDRSEHKAGNQTGGER